MKLTVELDTVQQRKLQQYLHTNRQGLATSQALKYKSDPVKYKALEDTAILYDEGVFIPFIGLNGSDVQYILTPCALGTKIEAKWFDADPIDLTDYKGW